MSDTPLMRNTAQQDNYAVIDIGTNSTRLLVFREDEENPGTILRANKSVRYTRMGQDVNRTGQLHPDAMKRNLEALAEYKAIAADYDIAVEDIYIFGTSAMRDAQNTQEFIDMAKESLNMDIVVIPGQKEAEYGFIGVSQCFDEPILIFDIGGGSTELIYGEGRDMKKVVSINMGCVRSTETYIKHDPPQADELGALNQNAQTMLSDALKSFGPIAPKQLVGIGGTATTISTIEQELKIYDSEKVHQSVITQESLQAIIERLVKLPLDERRQIAGLEAKRADIIIAGACILDNILKVTQSNCFTVCDFDNLEGAAYSHFMQ